MPQKREFNNVLNIGITAVITCLFVALGAFRFSKSYLRLKESGIDLWQSLAYYFKALFGAGELQKPSVTEYSKIFAAPEVLPQDLKGFSNGAKKFFALLFSGENAKAYFYKAAGVAGTIGKYALIILPCAAAIKIAIGRLYAKENTHHGKDTVPLKIFKTAAKFTYQPMKKFCAGYISFIKSHAIILKIWAAIWLFNLNCVGIAAEFLAYYFYFAASFDVKSLYVQAVKLFADLRVPIKSFPWQFTGIIAWYVFDKYRKKITLNRLRHFEARNCGFINDLPIVSLACGSMGKKKTTLITDMALSQEVMFRQKALEILRENDLKFPYFPWICFEKELQKCMEHHTVYNLASAKEWVRKKRARYIKNGGATGQLYGYNEKR